MDHPVLDPKRVIKPQFGKRVGKVGGLGLRTVQQSQFPE